LERTSPVGRWSARRRRRHWSTSNRVTRASGRRRSSHGHPSESVDPCRTHRDRRRRHHDRRRRHRAHPCRVYRGGRRRMTCPRDRDGRRPNRPRSRSVPSPNGPDLQRRRRCRDLQSPIRRRSARQQTRYPRPCAPQSPPNTVSRVLHHEKNPFAESSHDSPAQVDSVVLNHICGR
jgi:FtsZ-interacting cell division protein ZipA